MKNINRKQKKNYFNKNLNYLCKKKKVNRLLS